MSEAIKPTRGPWFTDESQPGDLYRYVMHGDGDSFGYVCRISTNGNANPESDARLIAEAGTVRHETGLSPRQLVGRVKELEAAAKLVLDWYEAENDHSKADFYQRMQMCRDSEDAIRAALSKSLPNTVAEVK